MDIEYHHVAMFSLRMCKRKKHRRYVSVAYLRGVELEVCTFDSDWLAESPSPGLPMLTGALSSNEDSADVQSVEMSPSFSVWIHCTGGTVLHVTHRRG